MTLPEDVALALLRGVGAYLRATPAPELPSGIRRFKGFRASALARHRDQLLDSLLEDETQRALILQWLDEEKVPLSKDDVALLRLVAERAEGWEDELRAHSREGDEAPPQPSSTETSAQREKEKLRKVKDELKRLRESADADLRAERARAESALQQVNELREELAAVLRRAGAAEATAASETERADREVRRARSAADRERVRAEEQAEQMRELRRELEAARARLADLERPATHKRRARPKPAAPSGPRFPLPVPKGRLADDPATLEEWLSGDGVLLLIDGYNVTKAEGGFGELELERQRDRLVQLVDKTARRFGVSGKIVFDGNEVPPGTTRTGRGPVKVVYSRPDEIADDAIIDILEGLPQVPVVLVTSDRELQERARKLNATIATSPQLLKLLR